MNYIIIFEIIFFIIVKIIFIIMIIIIIIIIIIINWFDVFDVMSRVLPQPQVSECRYCPLPSPWQLQAVGSVVSHAF